MAIDFKDLLGEVNKEFRATFSSELSDTIFDSINDKELGAVKIHGKFVEAMNTNDWHTVAVMAATMHVFKSLEAKIIYAKTMKLVRPTDDFKLSQLKDSELIKLRDFIKMDGGDEYVVLGGTQKIHVNEVNAEMRLRNLDIGG